MFRYPETKKAKYFHYTVGAPCFNDFDYGIEAKIWHDVHINSQTGFDLFHKKVQKYREKMKKERNNGDHGQDGPYLAKPIRKNYKFLVCYTRSTRFL